MPVQVPYTLHVISVARYTAGQAYGLIREDSDQPNYLMRLLDEVIELLEVEPRFQSFTLDGEICLLETYLAYRPLQAAHVHTLVQNGRLLIGPWYVAPNPSLVNAESLIRNLMIGIRKARVYGPPLLVGYLPEQTGNHVALPQIYKSFGIQVALMSHGLRDQPSEVVVYGDDGTATVIGNLLEENFEDHDTLATLRDKLRSNSRAGHSALLVQWQLGTDHSALTAWLDEWENLVLEWSARVVISNPVAYAEALAVNRLNTEYPVLDKRAVLVDHGFVVRDWNINITRGILRLIEPLVALAASLGASAQQVASWQSQVDGLWQAILYDQANNLLHEPQYVEQLDARTRYYADQTQALRQALYDVLANHDQTVALLDSIDQRGEPNAVIQQLIHSSDPNFEILACKLPADPHHTGVIVRGINTSDEAIRLTLQPWRRFTTCTVVTMNEVPTGTSLTPTADGTLSLKATPHRILTLWLHDA